MSSDWEFIFDGVFGYLTSPLWIVPINDFIDAQSVVFEASEENQLSWTEVHVQYKKLVESLLGGYLKDVGITEEQFMAACVSSSAQRVPEMQTILEQIYAADRFEIFKTMMVQRNLELQLQALEMIQKRQGVSLKKETHSAPPPAMPKSEEELLEEVLKQSAKEYEEAQKLKTSSAKSTPAVFNQKLEAEIAQQESEKKILQTQVLKKQEETKKTICESIEKDKETEAQTSSHVTPTLQPIESPSKPTAVEPSSASTAAKVPEISIPPETPRSAADEWMQSAREENESARKEKVVPMERNFADMTQSEMRKRADYLKEQRNRLLKLKKQEREKQLNTYTQSKPERPTSARVAKQAVAGKIATPLPTKTDDRSATVSTPSAEEEKKMAMRKALADKLKREVVYK